MSRLYVEVAVPLPLESTLTYSVPEGLETLAQPGCRARVQVGKRRLMGTILSRSGEEPEGFKARDLESIVDLEPVVPPDLLELARFVGEYYMAPPGDVLRSLLPTGLAPWGEQSIRLTDGGALALLRDPLQQRIVSLLHENGSLQLASLHSKLAALGEGGTSELEGALGDLEQRGLISISRPGARGSRYATAVDLAPGTLEEHLELCGRSKPGREAIEFLSGLGRPATVSELAAAVGCGKRVITRLVTLGILHKFTQLERLPLDRHLSEARREKETIILRPDQAAAVEALTAAVSSPDYAAFLLAGVTGAGKTEVYLRVVQHVLDLDRGAILMVPEISLVPALARVVRERFGDRLAILHSGLGKAERHQEWERIRSGQARVVLGPRSAIFAPVRDLAFVVVDEEQDSSYKQESSPRYNGRDVALVRAKAQGAAALLVSATPSLETRLNTERGRLGRLALTERVGQGQLNRGRVGRPQARRQTAKAG